MPNPAYRLCRDSCKYAADACLANSMFNLELELNFIVWIFLGKSNLNSNIV